MVLDAGQVNVWFMNFFPQDSVSAICPSGIETAISS